MCIPLSFAQSEKEKDRRVELKRLEVRGEAFHVLSEELQYKCEELAIRKLEVEVRIAANPSMIKIRKFKPNYWINCIFKIAQTQYSTACRRFFKHSLNSSGLPTLFSLWLRSSSEFSASESISLINPSSLSAAATSYLTTRSEDWFICACRAGVLLGF